MVLPKLEQELCPPFDAYRAQTFDLILVCALPFTQILIIHGTSRVVVPCQSDVPSIRAKGVKILHRRKWKKIDFFSFMVKILGYEPSHLGWGGTSPARDMGRKIHLCFCVKKGLLSLVAWTTKLNVKFFCVYTNDLRKSFWFHSSKWWYVFLLLSVFICVRLFFFSFLVHLRNNT